MPDPHFVLKKVWEIIRPGGLILMRFPNGAFHVPVRFSVYHLYKLCHGVKAFDVSNINLFAFTKGTISLYLKKAGFSDVTVRNDEPMISLLKDMDVILKEIVKSLGSLIVQIVKLAPEETYLISSSLIVRAVKPVEPRPIST